MLTERLLMPDREGNAHQDPSLYEAEPNKRRHNKKEDPIVDDVEESDSVPFTERPEIQALNAKIEESKRKGRRPSGLIDKKTT